jgi:ATP-binding cassette subfamily F protein uup
MPALSAQHLRKAFGPQVVLDDATFTLARGEKVGLIGANGAGKSTLAKILAGMETADGGTVSVRRGLTVRYLAQEPALDPSRSARQAVEDALTAWRDATARHAEVTARIGHASPAPGDDHETLVHEQAELGETIVRLGGWERGHEALGFLEKLGVREVDRPCGERSGGERRRIALAQLLVASPDVAILDEPTNHLDADTAAWLEETLAELPGAVLLVTHDRYFLDAVAQRIVEIERGRLASFPGGYGDYLEKKAERIAHEERVEQNRQNVLRREREWLARGPKARSTKQKARIHRAHELEARGPATAGRPGEVSLLATGAAREGKTILELRALQVAPSPDAALLNTPLDLIVSAGDRIGIVGPNGAGKTTLLRAILGDASCVRSGEIVVGKNTRTAYLDQARAGLDDEKSVFDDVRGDGGNVVRLGVRGHETMELRAYLELLLFDVAKQRQSVGSLSGGERARVALAKVLREGANLLVFDEPTNDLDLPTLAALEDLLVDFEGSVLLVTHDRALLDRVATAILAFEPGADGMATATRYAGGYQDYVAQRSERQAAASAARTAKADKAATSAKTDPAAQSPADAKSRARSTLTYAERRELEGIVAKIDEAEGQVAEIERLLADPALYAERGREVAALQGRLVDAKKNASVLLARWEELESKRTSP